MSEVVPGVHRLVAPLGDRYVCLFLVGADSRRHRHPASRTLRPQFSHRRSQFLEVDVSHIVATHADVDHRAVSPIQRACAPWLAASHALDRPLGDSVDRMIDERYREYRHAHEIDPETEFCDWVRANDDGGAVDAVIAPPAHIDLGDRRLTVPTLPGHMREAT